MTIEIADARNKKRRNRPLTSASEYDLWTMNRLMENSRDEPGTGCRLWIGHINKPGGYGRISYRGRLWRAHRLAYTLLWAPIPDGAELLHSCDNPLCINPNHLRPGTHAENIAEAYQKGRKSVPQGPDNPLFRLSAEQAEEAIKSTEPVAQIAARFGVAKTTIYRLKNGTTWNSRSAQ